MVNRNIILNIFEDIIDFQDFEHITTRQTHSKKVNDVKRWIQAIDISGSYWPPNLIQKMETNLLSDLRYSFILRLPRSAHFSELLTCQYEKLKFGKSRKITAELGKLINLFVTTFDAVCDDLPEMLPECLDYLVPLFSNFPNINGLPSPKFSATLCGIVNSLANILASHFADFIVNGPKHLQSQYIETIQLAFWSQIQELSVATKTTAKQKELIDAKSKGPFAVCLIIPHLIYGKPANMISINSIASALGHTFGWIDDLVDYDIDTSHNHPTSVSIFIDEKIEYLRLSGELQATLKKETVIRFSNLHSILLENGLTPLEHQLLGIVLDWINVS